MRGGGSMARITRSRWSHSRCSIGFKSGKFGGQAPEFHLVKMMLIFVIFFVLYYQISSYEFLYPEVEYLGGSCHPRDSCTPSRNEEDDHLWGNYTCECGAHCVRYGTCCADSPHYGKMLHVEYRGEACQKLSAIPNEVVTVFRCNDRWRYGFEIREKCETPEFNSEDPVTVTPVTSLETLVTYKNYFCALCNYDTRNISMWNIALQLRIRESVPSLSNVTDDYLLKNMVYNKEQKSWGLITDNEFYKLKLQFRVPPSLQKFVKKCYPNMVTQCDPSYAYNHELQYKCLSYYAPIQLKESDSHVRKYRNIHCAMCNNVNASETDINICKLDSGRRTTTKPKFSFALLLDINRNDGDLVGIKQVCGDDEKWDPFFKKCRSLVCAFPGHVIKNGKCVQT